jgi:hypothetical protein
MRFFRDDKGDPMRISMMLKGILCIVISISVYTDVIAQEQESGIRFGFCGEFGFGYHNIRSEDLKDFKRQGLGNVPQKSGIMIVSLGVDSYLYKNFQVSFIGSWIHDEYQRYWKNALGSGEEVELNLTILDIRVEIQPLFPFIPIYPYLSIGKTISGRLVDSEGDGFRDGSGDLHYSAGIDIPVMKWFGSASQDGFFGIRIGFVYRPSFAFKEFRIGDSVPVEIGGESISLFMGFHFVSGLF